MNLQKLKTIMITVLIFLTSASISGCSGVMPAGVQRIVPPDNEALPIYGTWKIEKCLSSDFTTLNPEKANKWLGKKVEFTTDSIRFDSSYWEKPEYKIKRVAANDYFFYNLRLQAKMAGVENRPLNIITVTSDNKFLYELAQLKPELLMAKYEDSFLYLKKESGKILNNSSTSGMKKKAQENSIQDNDKELKSGVMLGIRTPKENNDNGFQEYSYRTLWISGTNRRMNPVIQTEDILLPRKNGFWKLQVRRTAFGRGSEDIIQAYGLDGSDSLKGIKQVSANEFWKDRDGVLTKTLLYAGNDYICVELKGSGKITTSGGLWSEERLQTRPVDNLEPGEKGVKISDIFGQDGIAALENSKARAVSNVAIKPSAVVETDKDYANFSLYRKKGHWFVKGRLNFLDGNDIAHLDYDINLIPPARLVLYDLLSVPWTAVKDRVPEANDIFTSPNEDFAIVKANNKLFFYTIEQKNLSRVPLQKIDLLPGETVVMAEWATGNYVDSWEKIITTAAKGQ